MFCIRAYTLRDITTQKKKSTRLSDRLPEYKYARISEDNLTMEQGEIIGLLHVPINLRRDSLNPSQKELKIEENNMQEEDNNVWYGNVNESR